MHTVVRVGECDVIVKPSPVAMVWNEPGRPHDALAAPGVRLAAGEALVEVEFATICDADVQTVLGHRPASTPLVLGHEQVGRVVAVGEGAARADGMPLELGDRVVWSVIVSCGTCDRCRRGVSQRCRALAKYGHERVHRGWELSGGFATHVQLRAGTSIVKVSEQLPAAVAAPVSCATATAVAALEAASARLPLAGSLVLVTGASMLGLSAAALALEAGAEVIVCEADATRRAFAGRLGAVTVDPAARPRSPARLDVVLDAFAARGAFEVLVAIEASGTELGARIAIETVGVGGIAVLAGGAWAGAEVCIDRESLVHRLATVTTVHDYTTEQLVRAVAFLERSWQALPLDELVGSTHALAELDQAFAQAASGKYVRVGVVPGRRAP